jgi:hypothetical protein
MKPGFLELPAHEHSLYIDLSSSRLSDHDD